MIRIDGDNLRTGLTRDLGFSPQDRAESVRRASEVAALFSEAGVITMVTLISPYRADRDKARRDTRCRDRAVGAPRSAGETRPRLLRGQPC